MKVGNKYFVRGTRCKCYTLKITKITDRFIVGTIMDEDSIRKGKSITFAKCNITFDEV